MIVTIAHPQIEVFYCHTCLHKSTQREGDSGNSLSNKQMFFLFFIIITQKAFPEEAGSSCGAAEAVEGVQRKDGAEKGLVSSFQLTFRVWS